MESDFRSSSSSSAKSPSLMACNPHHGTIHHPARTSPFPQAPAPAPAQPPLLPLPVHLQASLQRPSWPASRPVLRAKKPRHAAPSPKKPANGASAPIAVAAPSKKRTAAEQEAEWTLTGSLYSVSPPPSSVPMPKSLLVTAAGRKVPIACAVEVAAGGGTVDVGATDALRRLLRL